MLVQQVDFPVFSGENGSLGVYQSGESVPFDIRRIFAICAETGDIRGNHAHKKCTQLLVCISGRICVACEDGSSEERYILEGMGKGLLIHPGIWARQEYLSDDAVLIVLCDRDYEESDYIRNYDEYKEFIGSEGKR